MRKFITAALAALTLVGAGAASAPAMAQGSGGGELQYRDRDRDGIPNRWDRRDNRRGESWRRHVRRCERAYRSYNVRMDSYRTRSGHWRRCRL